MKYMGGKHYQAHDIASHILRDLTAEVDFFEPFVGGFNIVPHMRRQYRTATCSDVFGGLEKLYTAVQNGWTPPTTVTEEEYDAIKRNRDDSNPHHVFAMIACAFGGDYAMGYARGYNHNYAAQGARGLMRKVTHMEGVTFATHDYAATPVTDNAVVYCDPPYTKTSGYKFGAFDHSDFIAWVERIVEKRNAVVFVSEFAAIDRERWQLVWAKTRTLNIRSNGNNVRQERLYRVAQQPRNDGLFTHTP